MFFVYSMLTLTRVLMADMWLYTEYAALLDDDDAKYP